MEIEPPLTKICAKCGKQKPLADFHNRADSRDGRQWVCKSCKKKYDQEYAQTPAGMATKSEADWRRRGVLSFTRADFLAINKRQGGRCANPACRKLPEEADPRAKWLCVDHDHDTGQVRGLLCSHCNKVLGFVGDRLDLLTGLVKYGTPYQPVHDAGHHLDVIDLTE